MSNSQAGQDRFVRYILNNKENGFFLEIGSNHPEHNNNTYILEKMYNWRGIMVEYDNKWLPQYKAMRPNSCHIIDDATIIRYDEVLKNCNAPLNCDYLQIDLDVDNKSTLTTLELLDEQIFDKYKFATVTFEHDIYLGNYFNTREISRNIFAKRGYVRCFSDICSNKRSYPFEDWYVHPDLVDMSRVAKILTNRSVIGSHIRYPFERRIY